jgi:O-antigen ligase
MMRVLRSAGTAQSRAERVGGRRAVLVTALAAVLICAGAWAVLGRTVRSRVGIAQDELSRVVQRGDADSDIGARIIAARAAAWALRAAPLRGHGAGSFGTTTRAYVQEHGVAITEFRLQKLQTAHNTPLNALATTGLVGGVLLFAAWACALWGAGRGRIGAWDWVEDAGTYGASPLFALLALFFAAGFEVIYMNMTMQALFSVLVALSPVVRPLCLHSAGPTGACGPG